MWTRTHSKVYPNVKKEDIWKHWIDINNWAKWHDDIEYCKLTEDFKVGSQFLLKPKGAPVAKVKIVEVEPGKKFTDCTNFIGAKMFNTHLLEETPQGVRLTNTTTVTGFLAFLWVKIVGENVAASAPKEMDALCTQAS